MARTKANNFPRPRPSLSTRTSHTGPFVRVASSPAHAGVSSLTSSQAPKRDRSYSHTSTQEEETAHRTKRIKAPVEVIASEKHKPLRLKKTKPGVSEKNTIQKHASKSVRRFRPGTVALREIRHYQKSVDSVIPRAPMQRLVRDVVGELVNTEACPARDMVRFRGNALLALREGMEHWMIRALECTNLAAFHGRRVTITPKDLALIRRIRTM